MEAEVFESVHEADRGERSLEESEKRLQAFLERITDRGLANKLKLKQSRGALDTFLELNAFILDVKKVSRDLVGIVVQVMYASHSSNSQMPRQRGKF